eukprot:COSAG05_NODE_18_length_34957_cov_44.338115_5_plen_56_part_00
MGSLLSGEKPTYEHKANEFYYLTSKQDSSVGSLYSGTLNVAVTGALLLCLRIDIV